MSTAQEHQTEETAPSSTTPGEGSEQSTDTGLFDSLTDAVPAEAEDAWLAENDPEPEVAEEATEETPEAQPEEAKAEETPEYTEEQKAEHESALAALRLSKYTTEDIEALSREQVIRFGNLAKAQSAEANKALEERAAQIKELESKATEETEQPSGEPTVSEDLSELLKPLRDEHGDELVGPLEKALGSVAQKADARVQQAEKALAERTVLMERMIYEQSRHQLGERFPALKDPANWAKALEKVQGLNGVDYMPENGDVFAAASGMVRDAAKLLDFEDTVVAERERSDAEVERARTNGTPTTTTTTTPPKSMSEDDKEMWILGEIEKGRPWEEVAREAGTL
jgi:murein DD-endopeptidase MepM/ murein hydrolase activator NlpD